MYSTIYDMAIRSTINMDEHQQELRPRRLRFAKECENLVHLLEADEEADAERTLAQEDYNERKERRKKEAEQCKEKGYGILLMDSFEDPVSHVQKHVTVFAQLPEPCCGRGLERQVSSKHDWERREWRTKCIQNVLAEESKLRYHVNMNDEDIVWDKLATVSRKASRSAKRFARRMGRADEFVVQHGELEDLEVATNLINEIRALQLKMNFLTARSHQDAGSVRSDIRSQSGRRSCSASTGGRHKFSSNNSLRSSRSRSNRGSKRRSIRRSLSDRGLERGTDTLPFAFDDASLKKSKKKIRKSISGGSVKSTSSLKSSSSLKSASSLKRSLMPSFGSFKSLPGFERGVDTLPGANLPGTGRDTVSLPGNRRGSDSAPLSPRSFKLPNTSWRSVPKSDDSGKNSAPLSPRSFKLPSTTWRSSPKNDDKSPRRPATAEDRRRMIERAWNSWSVANQNNSFSDSFNNSLNWLKQEAGLMSASDHGTNKEKENASDVLKSASEHTPCTRKSVESEDPKRMSLDSFFGTAMSASMPILSPKIAAVEAPKEKDEDLYGANNDFDDSIYFNRRRKKKRAARRVSIPKLSTLEELENSLNSSFSNGSAASTFFNKWGVVAPSPVAAPALYDGEMSLNLADIALPGRAPDEDMEESSKSHVVGAIRPRRRGEDSFVKAPPSMGWRGEETGPKPPPSARWSSSMPLMSVMPEDSPKEYPLGQGSTGISTKMQQLRKAEQWAMTRSASTCTLNTVEENHQSVQRVRPEVATQQQDDLVSTKSTKSRRGKKVKNFISKLSSSFRQLRGTEEPSNDTKTKVNKRRSFLTRWTSSHAAGKNEAARKGEAEKKVEPPKTAATLRSEAFLGLPVPVKPVTPARKGLLWGGHASSPAIFSAKDRKTPERTPSNSTVETAEEQEAHEGRSLSQLCTGKHPRIPRPLDFEV